MCSIQSILQPHPYNLHVRFERIDVENHHQSLHTRHIHLTPDNSRIPVGRSSTSAARTLNPEDDNMWIACPVVSRKHAELYTVCDAGDEPSLYICDNGSSGGTFVNEVPLLKGTNQKLANGDVIRFGIEVTRELEVFKPPQFQVNIIPLIPINDSPSTLDTHGRSFHCNLESSDVSDISRSEFDSDEEEQSDHELYENYNYGGNCTFDDEEDEEDEEKDEEYPAAQNLVEHDDLGYIYSEKVTGGVNKGQHEVLGDRVVSAYEAITDGRIADSEAVRFVEDHPTLITMDTPCVQQAMSLQGPGVVLTKTATAELIRDADVEQRHAALEIIDHIHQHDSKTCSLTSVDGAVNDNKRKREEDVVSEETSPTLVAKLPVGSPAARPVKRARLGYLKVAAASALAGSIGTLGLLAALPVGFFD